MAFRRMGVGCVLAATLAMVAPPPVSGQTALVVEAGVYLVKVAKWLAPILASYAVGKVGDEVLDKNLAGLNFRRLIIMQTLLSMKENDGAANARYRAKHHKEPSHPLPELSVEELTEIRTVKRAARSETDILGHLTEGFVSRDKLAQDRNEINPDLAVIRSTLADHERRLAEHDRLLAQQGRLIEQQGRQIDVQAEVIEQHGQRLDDI